MKKFMVRISKGKFKLHGHTLKMGQDLLVSLWGGTRPHIGAVGMAIPRPSLRDPRKWSATSSNFTFIGHKEDALVKKISEKLATELKRNVVVVAGIHWDDITSEEIKVIEDLAQKMSDQILKKLKR
ncbi:MAG: hypothetical protein A2W09_01870 [Deltaproteobacteria bacterium RBG_16_50_11]|nr:MAG: hypothetical protein A2W09_01870 [Deltaproteobacteria bacterium RBG_16_50_11]